MEKEEEEEMIMDMMRLIQSSGNSTDKTPIKPIICFLQIKLDGHMAFGAFHGTEPMQNFLHNNHIVCTTASRQKN